MKEDRWADRAVWKEERSANRDRKSRGVKQEYSSCHRPGHKKPTGEDG